MARWDLICRSCDEVQEVECSMFDLPACPTCTGERFLAPPNGVVGKTAVFPFETTHITSDGKPITVTDLGHLRRLEKQYGVVLPAFAQSERNPDPIKNPPAYRGWEQGSNPYLVRDPDRRKWLEKRQREQ